MTATPHEPVAEPYLWPAVDPELLALDRALAHPHVPAAVVIAGATLEIGWTLIADRGAREGDPVILCLEAGADLATIACPRRLVDHLLALLAPGLRSEPLGPDMLGLALELVLEGPLGALEQALGTSVRLSLGAPEARVVPMRRTVHLLVSGGGMAGARVPVRLSPRLAEAFARHAVRHHAPGTWVRDLRVPLSVRTGSLHTTRSEIATLRPGDILLLDEERLSRSQVVVAVAERLLYPADVQGTRIVLAGPDPVLSAAKGWLMTTPEGFTAAPGLSGGETVETLDDLPVTLVFELARQDIAVSDLSALGPGSVLDLGVPVTEPVTILGGGRRIGKGELVRVGQNVGIRILRLFGHGGN